MRRRVHPSACELGPPGLCTPALEGCGLCVSRVVGEADLDAAVELAARYPGELLMEHLVEGGEYTSGVLDGRALASIHIVPAGEYYDYHAKSVVQDTPHP